jgi:hypothetical protein
MDLWYAQGRRALVFRDGRVFEITYAAVSPDAPLQFFDAEGAAFPLKPGSTWFEIVGMGSALGELEPGSWKVRFYP